jgi:ligand-binding SRPBCC domain-containing protein
MGHINRSTTVSCPPDRVFAVLADVERLPEFSAMTVGIRNGPGRPIQTGDRFDQVVKILGKELESEWRATEIQEPVLLRFEGTAPGGAKATLTERLSAEGDGTRVELDVDYDLPLGILGDAVDAIFLHSKNEEQAEEILSKLKSLCEGPS